ncbi:amphi-Trp domain-containing protein [Halonotius roseus]|uniref:Amphi-Trp domain-containing protein n=1 Tax=Halonotius roseus TaxID=2511997 RepID=A0A544QPQ6_9EURY|nr:amphi-Trp domain-containing protein [Halonotius roseus]TQQ81433.1 amphi-Trp domain-containing protein [Halonotius roseus]
MPEDVLFSSEQRHTRAEIATYLRNVADKLDAGEAVTLRSGAETVTMEPPARPTFEVKAEREGPTGGKKELSIEFELEWDENDSGSEDGNGELMIE